MNRKTLTALRRSIKHWEENVAAKEPDKASVEGGDCALCNIFVWPGIFASDKRFDCLSCPVAKRTGETSCKGSPYAVAVVALFQWNMLPNKTTEENWRNAAREEVRFLRSLLPKKKRP